MLSLRWLLGADAGCSREPDRDDGTGGSQIDHRDVPFADSRS